MYPEVNNIKTSINASVFHGSYIGAFKNQEAVKKSQLQRQDSNQDIDDKTFRIMPNFIQPVDNIVLYRQTGKCFLEENGLFSCLSARRTYDFDLINSKFYVRQGTKIMRFVDLNVVWANVIEEGNGIVFTFQGSTSMLYIEPANNNANQSRSQILDKLFKNLRELLQKTDGQKHKLNYLATKNPLDFFKIQHILASDFQKQANSGDIILFKSQHSAATIQRVFTDSQYDHVGVILRNRKNEIFIYESTSDSGVGFTKWSQLIRYEWYTLIDKITWKPLKMKLTQSDIISIQKFVVKTLGKQFEINMQKLLTFKSSLGRTEQQEQKKTYFCSELVARLYKELGILNEQKSSTSYYPVDFSDNGKLKIIREGVQIANQRLISFDRL